MNMEEIRLLSSEELEAKISDTRHELMNMRFQTVTGQLTDTSRLKVTRRQIARMETVLRERELDIRQEGEE